ncbi:class I adenylate-forming enzyme family protein [Pseudaminobacter soli (ex Li et al. 2025)]|uniref:AMP-dependent synthetase n=1 Tax=Pseudaminobacter soli (ex Li et al. 2025) TaxID=1295366 RepID=A0A2P7SJV8_9HYPH|nr:class I adenylate-forming enzyme family protein [Mesorhizobium soli]PSJ62776.1 AMP-dependent synthetase [Mesorhizobium soli]
MRVETFLRQSAATGPDRIAIVADGARLSYAELDAKSDRLAAALAAEGVSRGDRVVVFMENVWETAVAIFAVLKAGAVFCPVNPQLKTDGVGLILRDCRPSAVLTQEKFLDVCARASSDLLSPLLLIAARATGALPADVLAFEALIADDGSGVLPEAGGEDDLAMIIYTSGSTGRPKGVMMTHASMDAASSSIASYLENTAEDIVLGVLPLSFTYGLYQLLVAVRVGARLVLEKNFAFPHAILEKARAEGVTGLPLVPTIAAMLLSMKDLAPSPLPALRYLTNAAAPLPPAHVEGLQKLFPGAKLYCMYGLTECARAAYLPPEELDRRPGSVGQAIPGTQAVVLDEAGQLVGPGTVGELVVRGPHLMRGYWENPEATDAVLRPGPKPGEKQLYTGDLFRTDADGFLYFVSRKDDMLKIKGEKVAPRQVEAALCECPGVVEAVAFGRPDPILGLALHAAVVVSDPAPTEREIIRHCARILPDFMVPKSIEFRAELPKTASGKVLRRLAVEAGE